MSMGFRFKKSYYFFQYPHVFCSRTLWKSNQRNSIFLYIFLLITEKPFEYPILKICQIRKISSHASYTSTERGTTSSDYHVTECHASVLRILINFLEQYFERVSHVYVATFMAGLCFFLRFLESRMQAILDSETQDTPVRNVVCGCSTGTSESRAGLYSSSGYSSISTPTCTLFSSWNFWQETSLPRVFL